ncbi:family 10 xylanase glycosyl hydrolase [Coprinopsis marcescibilis]|uniref:Beta-xylanase n=1 Tax=Coprinopsis marcescibilis TaxID=230819 RepID=A0A5C3KJM7_COPMA|nr:family 10 xylanase glycosyl hydrolase [Coprinopsis marcescibilis]
MQFGSFALVLLLGAHGVVAQLDVLAKLAGKQYFGSAVDNPALADKPYVRQLTNRLDFSQLTPSNTMKWETIQPQRGVFNFTGGDEIVKLAQRNGQKVRGHTCLWHSQLAPWVEAGKFDNATLHEIIHDHCYKMVRHYRGDVGFDVSWIVSWDVVNEAFEDDGTFRKTVFYNTTGLTYFDTVFRSARAADPKAKLYINDYNLEGLGPKSDAVAALVKDLKARGVPIDGIGVQGHLILGRVPTTIKENFQRFADLGVEVAITELDIRMELPVTPEKLEQQRKDYETVIAACRAVKKCIGVTIWDYTDKYSWVPGWFEGEGAALPWDEDLKKKPAYNGIASGWLPPRRA